MYLPKVNGFKAMVFVEGSLFHCNTLGQQPCYYLTKDLSEELQGLKLDDENAIADYTRGGFLEVYVPLVGSPDQIAQVRAWNDMEETQRAIQARKEQKRQREEEIAKNGGKKPKAEASQPAKKSKKQQKAKNGGGKGNGPRVDTNKKSKSEAAAMAAIADSVSDAAEQKVQKSQEKVVAKQEWIQRELKKKDEKRKKKRIVADTLKSNVEQAVKLKLSKQGQNQAKKQKKEAKKAEMQQVAAAAQKKKKSVKFSG